MIVFFFSTTYGQRLQHHYCWRDGDFFRSMISNQSPEEFIKDEFQRNGNKVILASVDSYGQLDTILPLAPQSNVGEFIRQEQTRIRKLERVALQVVQG